MFKRGMVAGRAGRRSMGFNKKDATHFRCSRFPIAVSDGTARKLTRFFCQRASSTGGAEKVPPRID
jgi:hypothetical protein